MSEDHIVPLRTYLNIFVVLIVLTMVTYVVAYEVDLGAFNLPLALAIAITKGTLVVLYFMHVKYSSRLVKLFVASGFAWLVLLILGTLHDYMSRGFIGR
jgi:cytochrome c oxidase subunit 4